jgi:hypothetical protein
VLTWDWFFGSEEGYASHGFPFRGMGAEDGQLRFQVEEIAALHAGNSFVVFKVKAAGAGEVVICSG